MFIQTLTCPARPARLRATLRRHAALAVTLVFLIPGRDLVQGRGRSTGALRLVPELAGLPVDDQPARAGVRSPEGTLR